MRVELTALVAGAVVGAILALMVRPQLKGPGAQVDTSGNVTLGLEDRSLR